MLSSQHKKKGYLLEIINNERLSGEMSEAFSLKIRARQKWLQTPVLDMIVPKVKRQGKEGHEA